MVVVADTERGDGGKNQTLHGGEDIIVCATYRESFFGERECPGRFPTGV